MATNSGAESAMMQDLQRVTHRLPLTDHHCAPSHRLPCTMAQVAVEFAPTQPSSELTSTELEEANQLWTDFLGGAADSMLKTEMLALKWNKEFKNEEIRVRARRSPLSAPPFGLVLCWYCTHSLCDICATYVPAVIHLLSALCHASSRASRLVQYTQATLLTLHRTAQYRHFCRNCLSIPGPNEIAGRPRACTSVRILCCSTAILLTEQEECMCCTSGRI